MLLKHIFDHSIQLHNHRHLCSLFQKNSSICANVSRAHGKSPEHKTKHSRARVLQNKKTFLNVKLQQKPLGSYNFYFAVIQGRKVLVKILFLGFTAVKSGIEAENMNWGNKMRFLNNLQNVFNRLQNLFSSAGSFQSMKSTPNSTFITIQTLPNLLKFFLELCFLADFNRRANRR